MSQYVSDLSKTTEYTEQSVIMFFTCTYFAQQLREPTAQHDATTHARAAVDYSCIATSNTPAPSNTRMDF
jgi:hypothetical protein